VLEEVKERRYYQKPSEKKRELNKRLRRQAIRLRRKQEAKEGF
jgi:ribosomal protein S21